MNRSNYRKGLGNIRTNADRVEGSNATYKAYLRIGALEMEKARRLNEKRQIDQRTKIIEARIEQIDDEKAHLLALVNGQHLPVVPSDSPGLKQPVMFADSGNTTDTSLLAATTATVQSGSEQPATPNKHHTSAQGMILHY